MLQIDDEFEPRKKMITAFTENALVCTHDEYFKFDFFLFYKFMHIFHLWIQNKDSDNVFNLQFIKASTGQIYKTDRQVSQFVTSLVRYANYFVRMNCQSKRILQVTGDQPRFLCGLQVPISFPCYIACSHVKYNLCNCICELHPAI